MSRGSTLLEIRVFQPEAQELEHFANLKSPTPTIFGRTDADAETPVLWPPHAKSWLIGKEPVAGRDWGQEEKGTTEDEMAGWHHRLDGHEFEWTPWVGNGQGGLVYCDSWGHKESDMTERLNWTELKEREFLKVILKENKIRKYGNYRGLK